MKSDLNNLEQRFVEGSIKLEAATLNGDSIGINHENEELSSIMKELRDIGKDAMDKLLPLLSHENNYVRCNVAFCMMPVYPDKARKILIEISQLRGEKVATIGFTAMITLREWDKGNLKFD